MIQLRSALHRRRPAAHHRGMVGDLSDDLRAEVRAEVDAVLSPLIEGYAVRGADAAIDHLLDLKEYLVNETLNYFRSQQDRIADDLRPFVRGLVADALASEALQSQLEGARAEVKDAFINSTLVNVAATVLAALFLPPLFTWAKKGR